MVQERLARRRYGSEVGQWSGWAGWSECSRSCGGGIRTQSRDCLQVLPAYNGTGSGNRRSLPVESGRRRLRPIQCVGSDKRFHMCSEQECPADAGDFRAEQCASFNDKEYNGQLYRWRPHYSSQRPCALTCGPESKAFYVTLRRRAADGTRCDPDGGADRPDHVCAAGTCKHIGCDGVVGSPRVRDACGVCGGNNSTCQIISGLFTEPYLREGYRLVVQIPAGACSISIEELTPTSNYLALRDSNKRFIVNGDWNIDISGQYPGAGATFVYRRQSASQGESIIAEGPITEPVDIFILYRQTNRGIKYEYAIKREDSLSSVLPRLPTEQGLVPALPLPSHSGLPPGRGGHRNALPAPSTTLPPVPTPYNQPIPPYQPGRRRGTVSPGAPGTPGTAGTPRRGHRPNRRRGRVHRPPTQPQGTAPQPRPSVTPGADQPAGRPAAGTAAHRRRRRRRRRSRFQWVVPGYSECTRSCGGGTRVPEVVCVRRKRKQLAPDSKCNPRRRPRARPVLCNTTPCPVSGTAGWRANEWSPCSSSCGGGHQTRTFLCVRGDQPVEVTECVGRPTEPDTQPCDLGPCRPELRWHVGRWSPCSVSCGWGSRTRTVTCTDRVAGCSEAERPRDTAPCRRAECDTTETGGGESAAGRTSSPAGWMVTDWSPQCSVDCGQGVQSRGVACGGEPDRCHPAHRPAETRPCKTDRGCGGIWFTGPWSQCSKECGPGGEATRAVVCLRRDTTSSTGAQDQFSVTADISCSGSPRPPERQTCGAEPGHRCSPRWFTAEWAACSVSCGTGQQRRVVACVGTDGRLAAGCDDVSRPEEMRTCQRPDCPASALDTDSSGASPTPAAQKTKPHLSPVLGPEYQTVDDTENEIQLGEDEDDDLLDDSVNDLSAEQPLPPWRNQLQAQTANQTVTARLDGQDGVHESANSGTSAVGTSGGDGFGSAGHQDSDGDGVVSNTNPKTTGEVSEVLGSKVTDRTPHEPATGPGLYGEDTGQEDDGDVTEAGQADGGAGQTVGGNASNADDADSCTDSLSHCSLVKRARLCQTSFYASSCCASCREER